MSHRQHAAPALLEPIQALRWCIGCARRPGSGGVCRVTRVVPPKPVPTSPYPWAVFVEVGAAHFRLPQHLGDRCTDAVASQAAFFARRLAS